MIHVCALSGSLYIASLLPYRPFTSSSMHHWSSLQLVGEVQRYYIILNRRKTQKGLQNEKDVHVMPASKKQKSLARVIYFFRDFV